MNPQLLSARQIFAHLVENVRPEDQQAYLDEACAGQPELRARVEQLLRAHATEDSFLEKPVARPMLAGDTEDALKLPAQELKNPSDTIDDVPRTDTGEEIPESDRQIGPYRLVRLLGEGGMGAVFLASQDEPIRRQVALKVIQSGLDGGQIIARFEEERQTLTRLDHHNIARIIDAGSTPSKQPYFVMELVDGPPITQFCNANQLSVKERLGLFVSVCEAIQHAHQNAIMHRDIKPGNVLVALKDGKAVPKVIDFGLAKATGPALVERPHLTKYGVVGTPDYMSPEQTMISGPQVDTRTDVYSLGVMLYELMTGTTPLDLIRKPKSTLIEVLKRIQEEEPPRPSERVLVVEDRLPKMTESGKALDAEAISRTLARELDWIILKALAKNSSDRYQTADALARDVTRYLNDEPVEACPPSRLYLLGKFARKHRLLIGSLTSIGLLLVVGVLGLIVGIVQVNRKRRGKAVQATEKAVRAEKSTRRALGISRGMLRGMVQNKQQIDPFLKAIVSNSIKELEKVLGDMDEEESLWPILAESNLDRAYLLRLLQQDKEAETAYLASIGWYERLVELEPTNPEYRNELGRGYFDVALMRMETKKAAEAEADYRKAVEHFERAVDLAPEREEYWRDLADAANNLGTLLRDAGRLVEAGDYLRKAISAQEEARKLEKGDTFETAIGLVRGYHNLGNVIRDQGQADQAISWYNKELKLLAQIMPISEAQRGQLQGAYLAGYWDRASAHQILGQHDRAIVDWKQAIDQADASTRTTLEAFLKTSMIEEDLRGQNKPTALGFAQAASIYAHAATIAQKLDERKQAERYRHRSVELLEQANKAGGIDRPPPKNP